MTRLNRRIGRGLLLLGFVLFMAIVIHPFALGGGVWGGKVENGRYFVASKGYRYTEVSEAQWRIAKFLESSFFFPVMLIWMGLAFRDGPGVPAKLTTFLGIVGAVGTASGVLVGWAIIGDPWTSALGAWLVLWSACFLIAWLQRSAEPLPSNAEPRAAHGSLGL